MCIDHAGFPLWEQWGLFHFLVLVRLAEGQGKGVPITDLNSVHFLLKCGDGVETSWTTIHTHFDFLLQCQYSRGSSARLPEETVDASKHVGSRPCEVSHSSVECWDTVDCPSLQISFPSQLSGENTFLTLDKPLSGGFS